MFLKRVETTDKANIDLFLLKTFFKDKILSLVKFLFSKLTKSKERVDVN